MIKTLFKIAYTIKTKMNVLNALIIICFLMMVNNVKKLLLKIVLNMNLIINAKHVKMVKVLKQMKMDLKIVLIYQNKIV